ncbi:hypothetical protein DPMN_065459 [Dreissena polymorpha]|uniref:Uncharacterized protein n=1 Tax=Dreissena polymorpha TaxID=45954 RepID=A0A9D3YRQ2_DREPO|nr:hypothetical protein DPMN_065459 [Dreissena polymorpha]
MEADMVGICDDIGVMREELMKEIKDTKVISADEAVSSAETDAGVSKVSAKKILGKSAEQILNSIQERLDRKNNIAFYNIPEGSGNIKNEKIKNDIHELRQIAKEMGVMILAEDILVVRRIGKTG